MIRCTRSRWSRTAFTFFVAGLLLAGARPVLHPVDAAPPAPARTLHPAEGGRVSLSCVLGIALVGSSIAVFEMNPALGGGLFGAGVHLVATTC